MPDQPAAMRNSKIVNLPATNTHERELDAASVTGASIPPPCLSVALQQMRAEFGEVALLLLRIREFRELAESFGDSCARQLGQQVLERLEASLRDSDQVFALEGGEFAITLPGPDSQDDLEPICSRLMKVCGESYQLEEMVPVVSAAIGVALYPADSDDSADLIRFSRIALRRADAGGGGVRHYSPEILKRQRYKIWMAGELERALVEQRFVLHYQPQFSLQKHGIVGMEALVRLVQEDGSLVAPDEFIDIADKSGLIVPLGYWVIDEACRQLSEWRRAGSGLKRISVNLSSRQLLDQSLSDVIDQAIARHGLQHSDLELEITESNMLEHLRVAGESLQKLRNKGVRIAIDDFGAGYSCFAALAQLPLDIFKMDRAFMAKVDYDRQSRHVVTAMVSMARELGYQVIAEGVETMHQHLFLQGIGCDLGQGFGLAEPQDANSIGRLLHFAENGVMAG